MVDTDAAQNHYAWYCDIARSLGIVTVPWDDLTDKKKQDWEKTAHDYERKVTDATDD